MEMFIAGEDNSHGFLETTDFAGKFASPAKAYAFSMEALNQGRVAFRDSINAAALNAEERELALQKMQFRQELMEYTPLPSTHEQLTNHFQAARRDLVQDSEVYPHDYSSALVTAFDRACEACTDRVRQQTQRDRTSSCVR